MMRTELCSEKSVKLAGFCFSFPLKQTKLNEAELAIWTKMFSCPGAVGNDVVQMLKDAIKRQNMEIAVTAVLNDTTATLVAGSILDPDCGIGLIIGTGSNACYIEQTKLIEKYQGNPKDKEVPKNIADMN